MIYLWVALGGAIGTLGRFCLSTLIANRVGEVFPFGTLFVNIGGSFIIGFFAALTETESATFATREVRAFVTIGLCGGYTTFSSFTLQTLRLAQDGEWWAVAMNVIGSNVGCLLAVWLGYICAMSLRKSS